MTALNQGGARQDGRCFLWDQRTNVLHLTIDRYFSFPIRTLCGLTVPMTWQVSTHAVGPGPVCSTCEARLG